MSGPGLRRAVGAGWAVLVLACAGWSAALLAAGVAAGPAGPDPALPGEPLGQLGLDTGIGVVLLGLGAVLVLVHPRTYLARCAGLGALAAAGGFALQSATGAVAVPGVAGGAGGQVAVRVLPAVAGVALLLSVIGPLSGRGASRVAVGGALLGAAALGASPLPLSWRCVLLLGLAVPVTGAIALALQVGAGGGTEQQRVQTRRLLTVLVATSAVGVTLAVVTGVLWVTGWTGLALVDPTVRPPAAQQTALVFWYGRLAAVCLAAAVLVARWRAARTTVESWFARGLAVALVAAVAGGLYILLRTLLEPTVGAVPAAAVATVVAAGALLPGYALAERAADRLLYGLRPAPYNVLAGLIAFSPATARDVPDLAGLAEAVGQGLGATTCRLTVRRPGLRDRSYSWTRPGQPPGEALQEFPVRHGGEQVGTMAIDREAVSGLLGQRRELLEAAAGSLGVVVQAVRSGIDLERQLRAALAHADDIATARRRLVAETDSERRRLERDLHDGAQHHLVSLRLALGLAEHQVGTGQLEAARAQLDRLTAQLADAEAVLARTASGVASPELRERGLVAALHAELDSGTPPVRVDTDAVPAGLRLGEETEDAVYFACLEAVGNARKHAPGADVGVRLAVSGARLEFAVEDDGPGYDAAAGTGSPGRGLRNLTARIASLGGHLEIRSAPGRGATVHGWVPLPRTAVAAQGRPPAVPVPAPAVGPPVGPPAVSSPLLDEVRSALAEAAALYDGTPQGTRLARLAARLGRPLRIAVVPAPGARVPEEEVAAVARTLDLARDRAEIETPTAGQPDPEADAHLLLWRAGDRPGGQAGAEEERTARLRPTQVIAVLLTDPPCPEDAADAAMPQEVGWACQAVVPVVPPRDGVPAPGRSVTRLRALVEHRFLGRGAELRARAAVEALEAMLRDRPPADGAALLYRLDRIRSRAPELSELALLDALHGGALPLSGDDRASAVRLLGDEGGSAGARLGCRPAAGPEELARAAQEQLARWQRALRHPASTASTRAVAEVLVRTCERLAVPPGTSG